MVICLGLVFFRNDCQAASSKADDQFVSIDFNNVDINVFIKFISELTGRNFVVDQRVKGSVTINSPGQISLDEAYQVFESVLEIHGYSTVPAGEVVKIVPATDARSKSVTTSIAKPETSPSDHIVTQLIPLNYASATEMRRLLAPLVSKSSVILAHKKTNTLIITDVQSNIQRLMRIIEIVDKQGVGQEIAILPLEHSDAGKLVKLLTTVFSPSRRPTKEGGPSGEVQRFMADERTNTIIMLAGENDIVRARKLIGMLDKKMPRGSERIRVYYLENAMAEDLAKVLEGVPAKKGDQPKTGKKAGVISQNVRVMPDKSTNSLIIMAEKDDFAVLEEMIEKLDIPRNMVFIESLIMEVDVKSDFNFGVEWSAMKQIDYNNRPAGIGGGFRGGGTSDLGALGGLGGIAGDAVAGAATGVFPQGFSIGVISQMIEIGGVEFPGIGALISVLKNDRHVHIIATPQIMTTDNEEAVISVGKNVPYQTKSGSTNVESFNSYEYRDVGLTLKITPHISKDRTVRLKIEQELTKLEDVSQGLSQLVDRPTTLKRTIDTTVIVKDKSTIVIGGLIDDALSVSTEKIPCVGDIPVLGWLFKSQSESKEKTNLYIFLTPHVVNNPVEAEKLYRRKRVDIEETIKAGTLKLYNTDKVFNDMFIEDGLLTPSYEEDFRDF
ncbi:MAG: type II secretion system secretin GspD [Thermodesulfobacteriota bacterium]|nr:type II secretion system secretin GspD [Thermodesulfobacteriota bacterium]